MSLSVQEFVAQHVGKTIGFNGECVSAFWEFNRDVNKGEPYSAIGACNLWAQNGLPYIWDTYYRESYIANFSFGDQVIWSGAYGAYPNGGYGHVALFESFAEKGFAWFYSQNPGPFKRVKLSLNGVIGALRAKKIVVSNPAAVNRVTGAVGMVRTGPGIKYGLAKGYPAGLAKGATVAVIGYVVGEAPGKGQANTWLKTKSGFYMHSSIFGNGVAGLKRL